MNRLERLQHDGAGEYITFYHPTNEWGIFSNFSRHKVVLPHPWTGKPVEYMTSEHRYQALKATTQEDHDYVAEAESPGEAKTRGGPRGIELRPDWGEKYHDVCYYVMLEVVIAKVMQHDEMQDALIDTQDLLIYEDSPTDDIWGWQHHGDYRGRNLLGQALMEARGLFYGYPSPRPFYL